MTASPVVALREIVEQLGGELIGDGSLAIDCIEPLGEATAGAISFVSNARYRAQLAGSVAGCVIVAPSLRDEAAARGATIVTPDPYLYYARLTQWWAARMRPARTTGVHASAVVESSARIGRNVSIGALASIEADAVIEDGATIGAQCHIGRGARIGASTRLAARVTVHDRCTVGRRGIVHSGAVIGADGFGFAPDRGRWEKIEQLGAVVIGDDVEIGANTCIDRGALGNTVIADGVKLDNLIQIGHNVRIGEHTAIAGCVGIAGSAVIGRHCTIGGAGMIAGHLEIVDHVHISGGTLVSHSIRKPGHYTGVYPIAENAAWVKNAATLRHLHAMRERLRALEERLPEPPPPPDDPQRA
ncbi:MAG: UDP-3-O-(3-hydroxymyristoyl)glucosamine N-acyltransferase [Proteobacteria bacterium]|nr:UDP-3-O-(3-hydroxymyristoyl)glucosamine N-acyltransferase [Pseudomonadota bacterium]